MDRNALWKWLILIGALSFSMWAVTPPGKRIKLGLDLKGGSSFTVQIDEETLRREVEARPEGLSPEQVDAEVRKVMDGAQERALEVLRNRVDSLGIGETVLYPAKNNRIVIQLPGVDTEEKRREAEKVIMSLAFLEFRMVHEKNDELVTKLFDEGAAPEGYTITQVGGSKFYRRDPSFDERRMDATYRDRLGRWKIPNAAYEFMLEKVERDGQTVYRPLFVKRRRELSGQDLKKAAVDDRGVGQYVVRLEFDSKGAKKFAALTADYAPGGPRNPNPNEYRQLAIVLDGTLYSAPVIREAIYGGRAEISGSFTLREATLLSNILNAGSLPAPLKIIERRFVAASLGTDSVRSGLLATLIGCAAVFLFMGVYYRLAGVVADAALLLNVLLLPLGMLLTAGFLGVFNRQTTAGGLIQLPVLTLPGIAGIALTAGMAVDANILIFERIREELRTGKRLWSAVTAGYDRAFITILDANLTTVLSAVIMFYAGSGPVRGFAVTLCAGILVSMFTAIVITRLMFSELAGRFHLENLRMLEWVRQPSINFLALRRHTALLSLAAIVVTWAVLVGHGVRRPERVLGVDFTGGASATFAFNPAHRPPVEHVRRALTEAGLRNVTIQYQKEMDGSGETLHIKTSGEPVGTLGPLEVIKQTLAERHPEAQFAIQEEDEVGPQIGRELIVRSLWAIGLSLAGMIVYLAWRFELGFAVGAIVALLHDVVLTAGVFTLLGRVIDLPTVAVLLTIIGYSVNDTIVTFDRIRENLKLVRSGTFADICNLSINQTLSRTLLTSLTVFLVVLALLFFGGGAINNFALCLLIGVVVGTYSSVFIATPIVLAWHKGKRPELGSATP